MAALGWLVSLAGQEQPGRQNEVIAGIRAAAFKTPNNLRAVWNLFYLCAVRDDHAGVLESARKLSEGAPHDPLAAWAFLYALGARNTPFGQRFVMRVLEPEESTTPLVGADLEHMLRCYKELRGRRPELAEGQIVVIVAKELRSAKREADEERFYREILGDARLIGQIAGAMDVAAERGDVEALIELSARYDRLQTGRSTTTYMTGSYGFSPSRAFGQAMNVCATRKDYAGVLKLVDFSLADARRKAQQQSPGAAARSRRARLAAIVGAGTRVTNVIRIGQRNIPVRLGYPQDNEYFGNDVTIAATDRVRAFQARRSIQRPGEPLSPAS